MLEPRIVAAKIQNPPDARGAKDDPARIEASSQGGLTVTVIRCLPHFDASLTVTPSEAIA